MTAAQGGKRLAYLDALRIIAAFLVIVNHTNSGVFQSLAPGGLQWWLSILWYYLSKIAVPVFVMISGACLLGKVDGYVKTLRRIARVVLAMLLFSYAVFLYEAWVSYGLWPRAVDFGTFFARVWRMEILDDYWYIFMYVGLLAMLPFLQRMARSMRCKDVLLLAGLAFAFGGALPVLTHYLPEAEPSKYLEIPLFSCYIGCLFMGYWIREYYASNKKNAAVCAALLIFSLAVSALLTFFEALQVGQNERYWFMDSRQSPSIFTLAGAACAMAIAKGSCKNEAGTRRAAALAELGGCAFAIYLLQGFVIAESKQRLFAPLCAVMPPLAAALCWEIGVFAVCLAAAWLIRRVPIVKKLL